MKHATRHVRLAAALALAAAATPAQVVLDGGAAGEKFGSVLALIGDVNGDGVPDVAAGLPDASASAPDSGAVRVLSGADGALLYAVPGAGALDDFGGAVASVGDVNGDGIPDLLAGAVQDAFDGGYGNSAGLGYAMLLSGANGSVLQVMRGETFVSYSGGFYGAAVAGIADQDGDGRRDLVIGQPWGDTEATINAGIGNGRVLVISSADGHPIREYIGKLDLSANLIGSALADAGDVTGDGVGDLLIGAPGQIPGSGSSTSGAVYLISGATGAVVWTVLGTVTYGGLGSRLALAGDIDGDGIGDVLASSEVAVHVLSGASGALIRKVSTSSQQAFGGPVAVSVGDLNADGRDDYAVADASEGVLFTPAVGVVRIFSGREGLVLGVINGSQAGERFGGSLAAASGLGGKPGISLIIGAPGHDGPAGTDAGRVTIAVVAATVQAPYVLAPPGLASDTQFGNTLAIAGDVDNDGWEDVVIGAQLDSTNGTNTGAVRVFSGRTGLLLMEKLGTLAYERLGTTVARFGDVNHDGHADVLASSPYPGSPAGPGRVLVWSGRTGATLLTLTGSGLDQFGLALAGAGDVNGDGVPDILVGAPFDDTVGTNFGAVRLFSGADGSQLLQVFGSVSGAEFGAAVASLGDVNGDGVTDLGIGVPSHDLTLPNVGRVLIASGATGAVLVNVPGDKHYGQLGVAVCAAGDVNGDGVPDMLVGEPGDDTTGVNAGRGLVLSGVNGAVLRALGGAVANGAAGRSVAALGDLDGDGVSELVLGAPGANTVVTAGGLVSVFSGATGAPFVSLFGMDAYGQFGVAFGTGGDVDNDGVDDLVVGVINATFFGASKGAGIVFNLQPSLSRWESAGKLLPGTHGAAELSGSGTLVAGTPATLSMVNALPGAQSTLVIGFAALSAPFKGGTLVPYPSLLLSGLVVAPDGTLLLPSLWPAGLPAGTGLWFQHWFPDAGAVQGFAASNAVTCTTP